MSTKLALFFVAFLVLGHGFAYRTGKYVKNESSGSSSSSSSSEESNEKNSVKSTNAKVKDTADATPEEVKTDHMKFTAFFINDFTELTDDILIDGKMLLETVLKDMQYIDGGSGAMLANIVLISEYLDKVNRLPPKSTETVEDAFKVAVEVCKLTNSFDITKMRKSTFNELLMASSMKKSGLEKFEQDFENRMKAFSGKFIVDSDMYVMSLGSSSKVEKQKFQQWLENFKLEKDAKNKYMSFSELFAICK